MRAYVLVLPKNVVKLFFFKPRYFFVCEAIRDSEFNQKINGNGFIAMTLIMNEKSNTTSNMINAGIIEYLDGLKYYDGRSIIIY